MIEFILNDKKIQTSLPNGSLLLDFIRYHKSLTGTKIGCREGDCGACTVLVGEWVNERMIYRQITSCLTPLANIAGKHVVTIEGLNMEELSPVQAAMVEEGGTQCGFCTVGFVVSLTGFCLSSKSPEYKNAIEAIDGNICRCTGYKSIERAAASITKAIEEKDVEQPISWLVNNGFIPPYFNAIPERLKNLENLISVDSSKKLIGGGTDLYVQQHHHLVEQEVSVLSGMSWLKTIQIDGNYCRIGASVTVTEFWEAEEIQSMFPRLSAYLKLVSSAPIRNISTIAGNFVNASPIGDLTAFFLALDAQIELIGDRGSRIIDLKDFYLGYKELNKTEDEIIEQIIFQAPSADTYFNFEKVSTRTHLDIAAVNTACQFELENELITNIHLSAGGVGPIPIYLYETGHFLKGNVLSVEIIKQANEVMQGEIAPISDVRGSKEYKRLLLRQLFYAHFITLFPDNFNINDFR
jgi:xanthine dehydrogenase small subunit